MDRSTRTPLLSLLGSLAAIGCGAKTGLIVPDASHTYTFDAAVERDSCVAGRVALAHRSSEIMLLIDRSDSMSERLSSEDPTTRWDAIRTALATTLPTYQARLSMGALLFPHVDEPLNGAMEGCQVGTRIDVPVGVYHAWSILQILVATAPAGSTPTEVAIDRLTSYLQASGDPARSHAIVLATDGEPNCVPGSDQDNVTRTASAIAASAAQSIPTYVIGINSLDDTAGVDGLNQLATAGGRPNLNGPQRYYSASRTSELTTAFDTIQRGITLCTWVSPYRPANPDGVTLDANGADLARDLTHRNGWDWTDLANGVITVFGPMCDRLSMADTPVFITLACDDS